MANAMGRKVQWGAAIVQRSDGTWATDFALDVHDHEVLPETIGELLAHLRRLASGHPVARALAAAAEAGHAPDDHHGRCGGIVTALLASGNPAVRALCASRNLRVNKP